MFETLMGTTVSSQSGLGNNGNEGVFNNTQSFRMGASPHDVV